MAKIKGIDHGVTITHDQYGHPLKVEIDITACHPKIKALLQSLRVIDPEPHYNPRFVAKIRQHENGDFTTFDTIDDLLK